MKKLITSFILVSFLLLSISLITKANTGLSYTKVSETTPTTIVTGVTHKKIVATSSKDDGTEGNQVVNVTTIAPNSVHFVSWTTLKESTVKTTNILEAIKDYETMHPEMMVVAAINDDYFDINNTGNMINPCVREGIVINDIAEGRFYGMGLKDDGSYQLTAKGGLIAKSEQCILKIYDSSKINVLRTLSVKTGVMPEDGETTFFYKTTTNAISQAAGFSVNPVNDVRIGSARYFKGDVTGRVSQTGTDYATVVTRDLEIAKLLDAGATIEVGMTPAGEWSTYETVVGIGSQFLKDGEVLSYDEIGDQGEVYTGAWAPRTSIGIKADGTVVFMTIDGRQSTKNMDGVTLRENGLALLAEGCAQGFNLDGGGSTTMAVLLDGQMTVVNSPSDGSIRHDADFILAVVPKVKMNLTTTGGVVGDKAMLMGSFNIEKCNGFNYEKSEVYLNGVPTGQTAEGFIFDNLEKGTHYNLGVYLTYKVGATSYTRPFGSSLVLTDGEYQNNLAAPTNPNISFEKTSTGFVGNITFNDPTGSITSVKVKNGSTNVKVYPIASGYQIRIFASVDNEYQFNLSYTYRLGLTEVYDVDVASPFSYSYHKASNQYTYRFKVDDTVIKEETADEGSQIVAPNDPSKDGYKFKGWDKEVGTLTEDITFNAIFEAIPAPDAQPKEKGGFNCNFGSALILSTIALGSILYILRKRIK